MNTSRKMAVLAAVLSIWAAFAAALAVSDIPWSNEAWSAIPAWNLAAHGFMGDRVLASKGFWLQGLDQHSYWILPMHSLVQAVWYKLLGFGLFRQRSLSMVFGALALVSWFLIVKRLTGQFSAAILAVVIVGFERNFLNAAANGRMDMMAAALGAAGIAAFLELRERTPAKAILVSHALTAAATFTHPCGMLFAVSLMLVMWRTGALRMACLPAIALPYLIGLGLWGGYIAQAPRDFQSQFSGNVSGFAGEYLHRERFSGLRAPWRALWTELRLRYLGPFGFMSLPSLVGAFTAAWLCLTTLAGAFALLNGKARSEPAIRTLATCAAAVFLMMSLFEAMKFQHYLVYSLPFLGSLAAASGARFFRSNLKGACACAALALMVLPQTAGVIRHFRRNPLRTEYRPVTAWIETRLKPGERVIAPAELGYDLGFTESLSDDVRLGFYTGVEPRFIVTSDWYRDWMANAGVREPEVYRHIQETLHAYRQAFTHGDYVVYDRNPQ